MEVTTTPKPDSNSSCIPQILAGSVGIVFVIVTVMILVALPTEAQLFNPSIYKQALQSQNLYTQMPGLLGAMLEQSKQSDDAGNAARYLRQEDYAFIIKELFPPEWMQTQAESLIDQTFAFYNTTSTTAKIEMPLTDLKDRLGGESGNQVMRQIIDSWPLCTTEAEQQAWTAFNDSEASQEDLPQCRPPENVLAQATPELGKMFDEMVADMPDTADLTPKYLPNPEATSEDPRPTLMAIRWIIKLSPLFSVCLLAVVIVLVVRSPKSLLGWWGALFLCTGIGAFLMAAIPGLMIEGTISAMVTEITAQNETGVEIIVAFLEIVREVLRGVGIRIAILGGLSGLMGLTMVVTAFFVGDSKAKSSEPYTTR